MTTVAFDEILGLTGSGAGRWRMDLKRGRALNNDEEEQ